MWGGYVREWWSSRGPLYYDVTLPVVRDYLLRSGGSDDASRCYDMGLRMLSELVPGAVEQHALDPTTGSDGEQQKKRQREEEEETYVLPA